MHILPNNITIFSALVALMGIHATTLKASAVAVLVCALLDSIDGRLARRLGTSSLFGKNLDSNADLIAFGVLPAMILWRLGTGYVFVFMYLAAVVFRIARHNTQSTASIVGVTSNMCAVTLAIYILAGGTYVHWIVIVVACWLMMENFVLVKRT